MTEAMRRKESNPMLSAIPVHAEQATQEAAFSTKNGIQVTLTWSGKVREG